jgi:hypothetical protein
MKTTTVLKLLGRNSKYLENGNHPYIYNKNMIVKSEVTIRFSVMVSC